MSPAMPFGDATSRRVEAAYRTPDVARPAQAGSAPIRFRAGEAVAHRSVIPLLNADYDPGTYSAGLIGFISAFVPRYSDVTAGDIASWASDLAGLGPVYFFSLNRYLFLAVRR